MVGTSIIIIHPRAKPKGQGICRCPSKKFLSVWLSVCLSDCLSVLLSVCLFVCLLIKLLPSSQTMAQYSIYSNTSKEKRHTYYVVYKAETKLYMFILFLSGFARKVLRMFFLSFVCKMAKWRLPPSEKKRRNQRWLKRKSQTMRKVFTRSKMEEQGMDQ